MNIKLEQLKKDQEINEQNRQSEIKALEDQVHILQSEEKNQLRSQVNAPGTSKRFSSWLKSWTGKQSELITEEEMNLIVNRLLKCYTHFMNNLSPL